MDQLIWKNKLLVLWILQMLNFVAVLVIPESFAAIVEEVGEAVGPLIAFYFFLTGLMMWLTVFTRPKVSRWPAVLVGVLYSFVKIQWIVNALTGVLIVELFLTETWGLVTAVMIIWYAWKIPQPGTAE
jgi:hypothetical protein